MENKLDPEFKAKWLAALRSGEYKQGRFELYKAMTDRYCCLGVAGLLCGYTKEGMDGWNCLQSFVNAPELIRVGAQNGVAASLIEMNDQGHSFAEIADYIEANL